ncbi:MAG: hypothetical protein IT372_01880 [Polyangiaceae bacterium]|nr:hypothetical protein [Polyangiaceae bacterium]
MSTPLVNPLDNLAAPPQAPRMLVALALTTTTTTRPGGTEVVVTRG